MPKTFSQTAFVCIDDNSLERLKNKDDIIQRGVDQEIKAVAHEVALDLRKQVKAWIAKAPEHGWANWDPPPKCCHGNPIENWMFCCDYEP